MHEFSIAMNIVDIVNDYAGKEKASVVREIEIEVGELSGIVMEALEFAIASAVKDTALEKARIVMRVIPGKARCIQCFHEYPTDDLFKRCPLCRSCAPDIIGGKELRVKSIMVD
jgi:hydrogenase nickel incorporation protein HypA/HybF